MDIIPFSQIFYRRKIFLLENIQRFLRDRKSPRVFGRRNVSPCLLYPGAFIWTYWQVIVVRPSIENLPDFCGENSSQDSRTKHLFLYLCWGIFFLKGIYMEYLFWPLIAKTLLPNLVEDFAFFSMGCLLGTLHLWRALFSFFMYFYKIQKSVRMTVVVKYTPPTTISVLQINCLLNFYYLNPQIIFFCF